MKACWRSAGILFCCLVGFQDSIGVVESQPTLKGDRTPNNPAGTERQLTTLRGHTGWVTGVAFSPDGKRLATCDSDATAKVWNLAHGQALFTATNYGDGSWSVAYSPNGRWILTAGAGGKLWDAETGRLVQSYPPAVGADWVEAGPLRRPSDGHAGRIEVVGFSPDGKRALTGGQDGKVLLWEVATGEALLTLRPAGDAAIHAAAFSPDGLIVAIGTYAGTISLWDSGSARQLLAFNGHTNAIESLAYFPNGRRIVTASYDQMARIWEAKSGREVRALRGHQGPVMCVAVSPDGRRVITGSTDGSARVWDAETGQEELVLQANREPLDAAAFSPDGTRAATTSLDRTITIWDVRPRAMPAAPEAVEDVQLESGYLPLPISLAGDPVGREIRSIRIVGKVTPQGDGAGEIGLDTREAELNSFGDVVRRPGTEPAPIRVELHHVATGKGETTNQLLDSRESRASQGFRLYDLTFPGGVLSGRLQLVLGTATLGPHRLLAYGSNDRLQYILFLQGEPPIKSSLPDAPLGREIDLTGYYTALDGRVRRLEVRGKLGGAGQLAFDPNFIVFDRFGEGVLTTSMGYQHHQITLKLAPDPDPLGQRRRLYWAIPSDPKNTNRVAVVLGQSEAGPHRVLVYRGGHVSFVVPASLMARREQEIQTAGQASLSRGEQLAIADLRQAIGHDFRCEIENGRAVALSATIGADRILPAGILARLPHLRSLSFSGRGSPGSGLRDLEHLGELKSLGFTGVDCEAVDLAALKNLFSLDSLNFYDCRGINDEGVRQLAGLTALTRLSFYNEEILLRSPAPGRCITDAGLASLNHLVRLQYLDLFGHQLSDACVPVLIRMTDLQELALSGHGFTDAGLGGLAQLGKLRSLRLFETGVTANGVAVLKRQLPHLRLESWGRDARD